MHLLSKSEALQFVRERSALFDRGAHATAAHANPFACSAWTLNFIEQVATDRWTFVIPESRPGDGSVMLLYGDDRSPHRKTAANNYYASLYSPLISANPSPEGRREAQRELVRQLVEQRPRSAAINFSPLDQESADTGALRQAFASHGWYTRQYDCFGNWFLPCKNLAFDAYMAGRDSRLYNTWTRKRKKFNGTGEGGARLEMVTDPRQVAAGMDAYDRVYAKSWKVPEPYPDFVRNWARLCADNGWLRLGLAWVGDTPIAAQFWFVMHGRAYIFKLAYDEDHAKLSAGTVLSAHMFQHVMEQDAVEEIDYLTGDDPYKASWMAGRRQRVGLLACNPATARGLWTTAAECAGALRQRWRHPSG